MQKRHFITCTLTLAVSMIAGQATAQAASIARIVAPTVAYANPGGGAVVKEIPTTTPYGHDQLGLRILSTVPAEPAADGTARFFYKVHLPYRRSARDSSNGHTGWISSDTAKLTTTVWSVRVNRGQRNLTLQKNGRAFKTWKVVVGKGSTPTPAGQFAVYGKTTANHGFDGTGILPFAYSAVHAQFDGGPGMVGMHGRSGASLSQPVGTAASNGCVRMNNANMEILLAKLPIGTPVTVI